METGPVRGHWKSNDSPVSVSKHKLLDTVAHASNSNCWEAEAEGLPWISGQSGLQRLGKE